MLDAADEVCEAHRRKLEEHSDKDKDTNSDKGTGTSTVKNKVPS